MRHSLLLCTIILAGLAPTAAAQQPAPAPAGGIKLSDVAGTWDAKTMIGTNDSVVATYTLTADDKGFMVTFPDRAALSTRVLASGRDSIVAEMGPYKSVLRAGQMVTTRVTYHFKGDAASGTFEARYASGDVLRGTVAATRRK